MREDFLHYLWRTRQFDMSQLKTTEQVPLQILDFGRHNTHAGADFSEARIQIGEVIWVGQVEMHIRASDWQRHQHSDNRAYDNVILHVVFEEDTPVVHPVQGRLPCLELRQRIPPNLYNRYWGLMHTEHWLACRTAWPDVSELTKMAWLDRVLVERLSRKVHDFERVLTQNQGDWAETLHQFMARALGMKVNAEPMQWLARSLPQRLLAKHRDQLFQLEALLFGQAGLLEGALADDYPRALQQEYTFLRHKHQLSPLPAVAWKFMRLRPSNFPTIRLAQWAQLLHRHPSMMFLIEEKWTLPDLYSYLEVSVSPYWFTHFSWDTPSVHRPKTLGKAAIEHLVINTIAPFMFFYGQQQADEALKERALTLLSAVPPEKNTLVEAWSDLDMKAESAYTSQALIELRHQYCDKKQCLQCAIGHVVLKK